MVSAAPAIYTGTIRHRRFRPEAHAFEYGVFMTLLDLDRLDEAFALSRLTGYNRSAWASFHDEDHLPDFAGSSRDRLRAAAAAAGVSLPDGPVLLLTHLRYGGYVFNPISLYYCHDSTGVVRSVLGEVNNTYGGHRNYWLQPQDSNPRVIRDTAAKTLYVSPFMDADVTYEFRLTPPGESLTAHMTVRGQCESSTSRIFDATLRLTRRPWTAAAWRRTLFDQPLMTAKVIAAIHWQALRLRMKGLPVQPFPAGGAR